ncbi:MAG: hypothetical protein ABFD89_13190, partial [Bryobacteraceae bacterium]
MIRLILFLTALSAWSQIPLDSGAAGVGGASNLTTAGAIPYVSAPGTLNQDPTALFWDAANDRLGIKANNPLATLDVYLSPTAGRFAVSDNFGVLQVASVNSAFSAVAPFRIQGLDIRFVNQFVEFGRFASTTGNLLIGTTTDSNFKLDVATSGSSGTARFYDQASPLGSTKVVVRAGAGQGASNLQEWQDSSGAVLARIEPLSNVRLVLDNGSRSIAISSLNSSLNSGFYFAWTNSLNGVTGVTDLSLSRASAGVLQVGDGGSNANGTILAANLTAGTSTPFPATVSLVGADRIIGIYSNTNTTPKGGIRWYLNNQTLSWGIGSNQYSTIDLEFHDGSAIAAVFKATTRNLLIGTATDSNFKLDVATSGSSGTARFYNQGAGVADATRVVVRAGAGQ